MKTFRVLAFLLLVTIAGSAAEAGPITVTAGNTVIFNFDLTGKLPPGPYDAIDILMNIDPPTFDGGDTGIFKLFNDFNAVGDTGESFFKQTFESQAPGLQDGIFSASVTMTTGSITLAPTAQGIIFNTGATPMVPGVPTPEPATWTLLTLGLAGAGVRRWRQRRRK